MGPVLKLQVYLESPKTKQRITVFSALKCKGNKKALEQHERYKEAFPEMNVVLEEREC
jgi:hypothetical protein